MFDYLIKVLPNGRILARNSRTGASETMKATKVSGYIEKALEEQIKAQNELDEKVASIKAEAGETPPEGCDHEWSIYLPYNEVEVARTCDICGDIDIKGKEEVK